MCCLPFNRIEKLQDNFGIPCLEHAMGLVESAGATYTRVRKMQDHAAKEHRLQ